MRGIRPERDRIRKALAEVGLEAQADGKVRTCSTGMKRRLVIGKMLLFDPEPSVPRRAAQHPGPGRHRAAQRLCGVGAGPRRVGHRGDP
ncbi:MAG: hypothetical protein MZW92_38565 [Comamonadaceae bacterium]|nr:hypothetical protein [Comamonadaceae bacterium]